MRLINNYIYLLTGDLHNKQDFNPSITPIDLSSYLNNSNFNVTSSTVYAYVIHPNIVKVTFTLYHARTITVDNLVVFGGANGTVLPANLRPTIICSSVAFNDKYSKLFEVRCTTSGELRLYVYADRTLSGSTTTGTIYLYRGAV